MLTRRREQIVLLFGLITLNALLGWYAHRLWSDHQSRTQWIYAQIAAGPSATLTAPPGTPAGAQSFAEIVDRNLFSPERTSHPPEAKEAKAPELPLLYGTMNLGNGWFALMAPGDQASGLSKQVLPGEEIGRYKLVSIASSQVVVEWGEKKFTIDASESARRVPRIIEKTAKTEKTAPARSVEAPAASGTTSHVTTVAPLFSPSSAREERKKFSTAGYNAPPGAPVDAPAGTVFGGKRKVEVPTPFGTQVGWEDVEQTKGQTGKETEKKSSNQ